MAAKKSYGFANTQKPKSAFETYHKETYHKMRGDALEYLTSVVMKEYGLTQGYAQVIAERRLKSAEDGDCGCPRR